MTEIEDMAALADELDTYAKRYSGDWSNALPSMSWAKLELIVKALRSAARTDADGAGFEALRDWMREPDYAEDWCLSQTIDWLNRRPVAFVERLAALPAPGGITTGWQPIETVPKNHLPVLTWSEQLGRCIAFRDVTWVWWPCPATEPLSAAPTHWQPLPPAPTITRKSQSEDLS